MVLHALLVEDNKVIRDNLISTLDALSDARVDGVAETEADAIAWLESHYGWGYCRRGPVLARRVRIKRGREVSGTHIGQACDHFSDYATDEVRRRALELSADAVFDKSTKIDGLLDFLERRASA